MRLFMISSLAGTALLLSACSGESENSSAPVSLVVPEGVGVALQSPSLTSTPDEASVNSIPAQAKPELAQAHDGDSLYDSMKAKAESGDVEARFEVAMMHLLGTGGATKDRDLAVAMLKRASEEGSARATSNLASLLLGEEDVARDEIFNLYERAAQAGDIDAKRNAAFVLAYQEDGITLVEDKTRIDRAIAYLNECAVQGDLFADAMLGGIYADQGKIQEAVRVLEKPAMAGVSQAMDRVMLLALEHPESVSKTLVAKIKAMQDKLSKG